MSSEPIAIGEHTITREQCIEAMALFAAAYPAMKTSAISSHPGDDIASMRERTKLYVIGMSAAITRVMELTDEEGWQLYAADREFRRLAFGCFQEWSTLPPAAQDG